MSRMDGAQAVQRLQQLAAYLEADPANTALLAEAIDTALAAGELQRAAALAQRVQDQGLDDAGLRARCGNVLLAQRKWDEAARLFGRLHSEMPSPASAAAMARALHALDQDAAAYAVLAPYLNAPVADAVAPIAVRVLHRMRRVEQGAALAEAAAAAGDAGAELLAVSALVLVDAGKLDSAEVLAARALAAGWRSPEALMAAGTAALGRSDLDGASALFQEILARQPDDGRAWAALGAASLQRGALPAAREQLERAVAAMPAHIGTWQLLGWTHVLAGDGDAALEVFQHALQLDHNVGESHGGLAVAFALQGRSEEAHAAIARALALAPGGLAARYAQMVLDGTTSDAERFRVISARWLRQAQGAFGRSLHDIVQESASAS